MSGEYSEDEIERLARRLYEKMEELDPGLDPLVEWVDLSFHDREFYRACVAELLAFMKPGGI